MTWFDRNIAALMALPDGPGHEDTEFNRRHMDRLRQDLDTYQETHLFFLDAACQLDTAFGEAKERLMDVVAERTCRLREHEHSVRTTLQLWLKQWAASP